MNAFPLSPLRISLIGAGNVATHFARALAERGHCIDAVLSRHRDTAERLALPLHAIATTEMAELPDSDIFLFAVSDDALAGLAQELARLKPNALFVHTAGSVPMEVFQGLVPRYGVIYPLQTFSREKAVRFEEIPLFVEAGDARTEALLTALCRGLSEKVVPMASEQRRRMHLAAVFACNFANHCFGIASDLAAQSGVDFRLLLPLIDETAAKTHALPPREAQTGPAVRWDEKVMAKHLELLADDDALQDLYRRMSRHIHDTAKKH